MDGQVTDFPVMLCSIQVISGGNWDISCKRDFPGAASGKEPIGQCRRHKRWQFNPWVGKIPWRRAWQPTLVFLPGESHGQRSLTTGFTHARKLQNVQGEQLLWVSRLLSTGCIFFQCSVNSYSQILSAPQILKKYSISRKIQCCFLCLH